MNTEKQRAGNFSSSEIYKLLTVARDKVSFGKPALTYIEEKQMEIRLGRSLTKEHNAKPTNWGKLAEQVAFDRMGLEYRLVSKERYFHPKIKRWCGMPDVVTDNMAGDIKCPWTLKSFCEMVDAMTEGVDALRSKKPEYYWQIVSNCILTNKHEGALFVYCPYKEDLAKIREAADYYDGDQNKVAFVNWMDDEDMPYIEKGGYYKDMNQLTWQINKDDIQLLTDRIKESVKLLNS